jgi:hypothetical protein
MSAHTVGPGHDYKALNAMVRRHKTALARAKNSGSPEKVIEVVDKALADFDATIAPDNWRLWAIAKEDAESAIRKREAGWKPYRDHTTTWVWPVEPWMSD